MATPEEIRNAEARLSALLEELIDLLKPSAYCDDPDCSVDHEHVPDGPWMIDGWAIAIDLVAESKESEYDIVETWTTYLRSKGLPQTQCIGLGHSLIKWAGG